MLVVEPGQPVRQVAARHPLAIPVLRARGIDPDGPGSIDADGVAAIVAAAEALVARWRDRPLCELVDHLVGDEHPALRRELDQLAAAARADRLAAEAVEAIDALRADVVAHLDKEEQVLLPWLRRGRGVTAARAVRSDALEHADLLALLARVQRGLRAIAGGAATRAVADEVERRLCAHMHLESQELFPRALAAPRGRGAP